MYEIFTMFEYHKIHAFSVLSLISNINMFNILFMTNSMPVSLPKVAYSVAEEWIRLFRQFLNSTINFKDVRH